jgi:hypothetical protein
VAAATASVSAVSCFHFEEPYNALMLMAVFDNFGEYRAKKVMFQ